MSELLEMIKRHEGYRRFPYRDPMGVLTVGYGRNLDQVGLDQVEAEFMLLRDVQHAEEELLKVLPSAKHYTGPRYDALVDMMFNLGAERFSRFRKMLEALRAEDFDWAADEMFRSNWAGQVGKRAEELADLVREG